MLAVSDEIRAISGWWWGLYRMKIWLKMMAALSDEEMVISGRLRAVAAASNEKMVISGL